MSSRKYFSPSNSVAASVPACVREPPSRGWNRFLPPSPPPVPLSGRRGFPGKNGDETAVFAFERDEHAFVAGHRCPLEFGVSARFTFDRFTGRFVRVDCHDGFPFSSTHPENGEIGQKPAPPGFAPSNDCPRFFPLPPGFPRRDENRRPPSLPENRQDTHQLYPDIKFLDNPSCRAFAAFLCGGGSDGGKECLHIERRVYPERCRNGCATARDVAKNTAQHLFSRIVVKHYREDADGGGLRPTEGENSCPSHNARKRRGPPVGNSPPFL